MTIGLRLKNLDEDGLLGRRGAILQMLALTAAWLWSSSNGSLTSALVHSTPGNLGALICHFGQISGSLLGLNCYEPWLPWGLLFSSLKFVFHLAYRLSWGRHHVKPFPLRGLDPQDYFEKFSILKKDIVCKGLCLFLWRKYCFTSFFSSKI